MPATPEKLHAALQEEAGCQLEILDDSVCQLEILDDSVWSRPASINLKTLDMSGRDYIEAWFKRLRDATRLGLWWTVSERVQGDFNIVITLRGRNGTVGPPPKGASFDQLSAWVVKELLLKDGGETEQGVFRVEEYLTARKFNMLSGIC